MHRPAMTPRRYLFVLPLLMGGTVAAQTEAPVTGKTAQDAQEQQRSLEVRDAVQGGWSAGDQEKDHFFAPRLDENLDRSCLDQLNQFRSERNTSLSLNQGVIPPADQARLQEIAGALPSTAPQSFETHHANFYLEFPKPSAFMELDLATAKGRDRNELIAPQLVNSARLDTPIYR